MYSPLCSTLPYSPVHQTTFPPQSQVNRCYRAVKRVNKAIQLLRPALLSNLTVARRWRQKTDSPSGLLQLNS